MPTSSFYSQAPLPVDYGDLYERTLAAAEAAEAAAAEAIAAAASTGDAVAAAEAAAAAAQAAADEAQAILDEILTFEGLTTADIGVSVQAYDSDLQAISALATTSYGRSLLTSADAAAARSTLGAQASGSYQPLDSDLTDIAALTTTTYGRSLLTQADAAAARTTLGTPATANVVAKTGDVMTGNLTIDPTSGTSPALFLDKAGAADQSYIQGTKNGLGRWTLQLGETSAESGSNAGSNFAISRHNDAGAFVDAPFQINRATGFVTETVANPTVTAHRYGAGNFTVGTLMNWVYVGVTTLVTNIGGWAIGGGGYDLVAPRKGVYLIVASFTGSPIPASNGQLLAGFAINATTPALYYGRLQNATASGITATVTCTAVVALQAGDSIRSVVFATAAGTTITDDPNTTFLHATMLSAW